VWFDWTPPIETSVSQPCVGDEVLELARLVPAVREPAVAILALRPDLDQPPEVVAQPLEGMHRRRAEEELDSIEVVEARPCHQRGPGIPG
jgi:hypothetical protein